MVPEDVALPPGFVISIGEAPTRDGYREAAGTSRTVRIENRWRDRFGAKGGLMVLWGVPFIAGGTFIASVREGWRPEAPPLWVAVGMLLLGCTSVYVGLATLLNRTRVTVPQAFVLREMAPLPWRARRIVWQRRPEPTVKVLGVRNSDVRNGGVDANPTERHEVVLVAGNDRLVLFDQIVSRQDAESIATTVRHALAGRFG